MFDRLYSAVTDLPVIVQGALGSALFAGTLYVGQKAVGAMSGRMSKFSKHRRSVYLIERQIKYNVIAAKEVPERGAYVTLLVYRASRSLFKALIWLTMGLITGSFDGLLGSIGFLGCLYYLFVGLSTLSPPGRVADIPNELESIRQQLDALRDA